MEYVELEKPDICGGVFVSSKPDSASVNIDNISRGETPIEINNLLAGKHKIRVAKNDYKSVVNYVAINENEISSLSVDLKPLNPYAKNGYKFLTVDLLVGQYGDLSYVLTYGYIKKYGWFASLASSFDFKGYNTDYQCGNDFVVDGYYPEYTGIMKYTCMSVMGGFIMRIADPVSVRVGVGYGMRAKSCETVNGYWVKNADFSTNGIEALLGLQCVYRGLVISVDGVTTNFKHYEIKIGLGFGLKNK